MRKLINVGVGLLAVLALAGCGGVIEEPVGEVKAVRGAMAALEAEQGQSNEEQGKPCLSTADCPPNGRFFCTAETGVCNPPPGCNPEREFCPAVCFGTCEQVPGGEQCGEVVCPKGTECCNPLRSICVPPGDFCIF
jgi:hypothetical protein